MRAYVLLIFITVILIGTNSTGNCQTPVILSVSPTQNALNVSANEDISITFNTELDESTLNSNTIKIISNIQGIHQYFIEYDAVLFTITLDISGVFLPGEIVTVILTNQIQSLQGINIADSYIWTFTIETDGGVARFELDSIYGRDEALFNCCRRSK